ncbi:MAG: hypothetical protein GXP43_01950 [bacterium]|nr:hypothetical protein [bacterium]
MKRLITLVISLLMIMGAGLLWNVKSAEAVENQFRVYLVGQNGVWIECWASKSFCWDLPRYLVYPVSSNSRAGWVRRRLLTYSAFYNPGLFTAYFNLPPNTPWFRIEAKGQAKKTVVVNTVGKWRVVNKTNFVQFHRVGWRPSRF